MSAGSNGSKGGARPPDSTVSGRGRQRRTTRKVVHAPITEPILQAVEKSYKENAMVLRLADALRQEWFKSVVAPQPEPIVDLTWDSGRPKVLLVVNSDGYVEAYARDVDIYAVELQPWEDVEEEVAKLARCYRDLHWPVLLRETAMTKWLIRPQEGYRMSGDESDALLWKVNSVVKNMLLEEART